MLPVLINYFQDRKMRVKWHNQMSKVRDLPGGGPQGCNLGLIEYDFQSNDNTDFLSQEDKFKFVDDLTMLEILNLISVGISSYNFRQHVASDIGINQQFIPSENIKSQEYMDKISEWTDNKKMKLNVEKSNVMIFNETKNYQFATRIQLNETILETVKEAKLLGTIVSSDLTWHSNSQYLTQRGYQRMIILRKLYEFNLPNEDLVQIYTMYIRSVIEYNSNVWFSSITNEERENLERVQRVACKIILKDDYENYDQALETLNLQTLSDRRQMLARRFAEKCTKSDRFKDLFPLNDNLMGARNKEKFKVNFASTDRLKNSTIPAMQRLLNRPKK